MFVDNICKNHIKVWGDKEEFYNDEDLVKQVYNLASLPYIHHHVALMPDYHLGYGVPIGCVFGTKDVIIPNAAGNDLNCGVIAQQTTLKISELDINDIKKSLGLIRNEIPVGFRHHAKSQCMGELSDYPRNIGIIEQEYESATKQLGTLGGGNHFIELQKDETGFLWIMIHSGSRNIGLKIATYYNNLAKELNIMWKSDYKKDLYFLPIESNEGYDYIIAMQYAAQFASKNRETMLNKTVQCLQHVFGYFVLNASINISHNYVSLENHFGENVWIHRKGATLARNNMGIIPGSQGTSSYIVLGKNNPDSFTSCSHGAGRSLSRKKAKEQLTVEAQAKKLDDLGIIHSIRNVNDLDEAPDAYKNIDQVMKNQDDLVEIIKELKPIAVIKG